MNQKERVVYDKAALRKAVQNKFSTMTELGALVGKSTTWISDALNPNSKHNSAVSERELRLICHLCDIEYESILQTAQEVPKQEVTPAPVVAPPAPSVVINQNITLTDDQFTWAKDAYAQLRKDDRDRHEALMEKLDTMGRILVDLYNIWRKGD